MQVHASLYFIQYCGRGPHENYPDRKEGSAMGVYNTTPSEMAYLDYIVPSENGSRSDCEYVAFRSRPTGDGFCAVSTDSDGEIMVGTWPLEHPSDLPVSFPRFSPSVWAGGSIQPASSSKQGTHAIYPSDPTVRTPYTST